MQHVFFQHDQGFFALVADQDRLVGILWRSSREEVATDLKARFPVSGQQASQFLSHAWTRLAAFLAGESRQLDLPYELRGVTPFQRQVLQTLQSCPYGATLTYGELARQAGRPGAARAVGAAMAGNPLPLLIPCHRVTGAGGRLTGYSGGRGLASKKFLLELEARKNT